MTKQSEEGQQGVCGVIGKLDRPWKNDKQKVQFHGSPLELKGQGREGTRIGSQKTCLGNKLVLTEHFSSGEKWGQRVEITAQAINLWKCQPGTKWGRRNQKGNGFNFLD